MKFARKCLPLLALTITAAVAVGCWDDEIYDAFVDQKGDGSSSINTCPDDAAPLYIEYASGQESVNENGNSMIQTKYRSCSNTSIFDLPRCSDDPNLTKEQQKIYKLALDNQICPKGTFCQLASANDSAITSLNNTVYYCTPQKAQYCDDGTHYDTAANGCIPDDRSSCGGIDCTRLAGWILPDKTSGETDPACVESKCVLKACADGYHVVKDNDSFSCAVNGDHACEGTQDPTDYIAPVDCDIKKVDGAEFVYCINNQCEITKCKSDYHWLIDNGTTLCEKNTIEACGFKKITVPCSKAQTEKTSFVRMNTIVIRPNATTVIMYSNSLRVSMALMLTVNIFKVKPSILVKPIRMQHADLTVNDA